MRRICRLVEVRLAFQELAAVRLTGGDLESDDVTL